MACIRKRRGKYVVDYRDGAGIRRWVTCETRRQAEDVLSERVRESRQVTRPVVDAGITLEAYATRWLGLISGSVKRRTAETYAGILTRHILPALGRLKVRELHRGRVKALLAEKLGRGGLSRGTVSLVQSTLRALLNAAVDDGVLVANPADRLGRQLRLIVPKAARQEEIKALNREQVEGMLSAAWEAARRLYPFFLTLVRTGLRLGEALALQWDDLDFTAREIRVARSFSKHRLETPKSGHGRTVDMSKQLAATLKDLHAARAAETLKGGWAGMPPWVFCTTLGTPLSPSRIGPAFKRILKAAGLPTYHSPHNLRHTFASLLLQQGESPAYVQRQLGHASCILVAADVR